MTDHSGSFPFWDRLRPSSPLRRAIGWPPQQPPTNYVPREYVWVTQIVMWGGVIIDDLQLPFDHPDLLTMVLHRAERFFDIPGEGGQPRVNAFWASRRMPKMYLEALRDLAVMVGEWRTAYSQWSQQ